MSFLMISARLGAVASLPALAFALAVPASAQQPAQPEGSQQPAQPDAAQQSAAPAAQSGDNQKPANQATQPPAGSPAAPAPVSPEPAPPVTQATPAASPASAAATEPKPQLPSGDEDGVSEEELRKLLFGKTLYLRGGYLDDTLKFDEHGRLIGHSPQGSFTLNTIEINKIKLTKHKVELEGIRYGLHFSAQLAYEDPSTAFDRVRITPRKRVLAISIDREMVVKPKKQKEIKPGKEKGRKAAAAPAPAQPVQSATQPEGPSEADQPKASIAATPETDRPADLKSVTTTTSQRHSTKVLKDALDKIFAQGIDAGMRAALPDFWRFYFEAAAAKSDYRPKDPAILRQNTVDQKAVLLSKFEPDSNEYAQAKGVAGMALYHTVVGADGKAQEIAVGRPIGFGLDENAVAAIRKANFQPAMKDGKAVPVLLDLVVQFRIFSNRTNVHGESADKPAEPILPGPYSVPHS